MGHEHPTPKGKSLTPVDRRATAIGTQELTGPTLEHLQLVEQNGLIPNAVYFETQVPNDKEFRRQFHEQMKQAFAASNLVFYDPDNGLEVARGQKDSNKYAY